MFLLSHSDRIEDFLVPGLERAMIRFLDSTNMIALYVVMRLFFMF